MQALAQVLLSSEQNLSVYTWDDLSMERLYDSVFYELRAENNLYERRLVISDKGRRTTAGQRETL